MNFNTLNAARIELGLEWPGQECRPLYTAPQPSSPVRLEAGSG